MLLADCPSGTLPRRAWPASCIVRQNEWDDTNTDVTMPQVFETYNHIINQPPKHRTLLSKNPTELQLMLVMCQENTTGAVQVCRRCERVQLLSKSLGDVVVVVTVYEDFVLQS